MTRVLVVEDDVVLQSAVERALLTHGYEVRTTDDAASALDCLRTSSFDILLTDLRLNDQSGIDLIRSAARVASRTRTILMSAFATARDHEVASDFGVVRVLTKPFLIEELLTAVRDAADSDSGFRGSIHGLSVVDLLQMYHFARRSIAIELRGATEGTLLVESGEIVHAKMGELTGESALRALLSSPTGAIRTGSLPVPCPRSIERRFDGLLLDALRTNDETAHDEDDTSLDRFTFRPPPLALDQPSAELEPALQALPEPPPDYRVPIEADRDASDPNEERKRRIMANLKDSLNKMMTEIDGCMACCAVDSNSGMMLGAVGSGVNLEVAAAGNTEVVRAKRKTMRALDLKDAIDDILITLGRQYHIIRPLQSNDALFVYVVLDRNKANLAMSRHVLTSIERELTL